ncbi:hypothetical protein JW711_05275 [Candidatus Woesearchaeota archaeon]|nr:hypothetical protein [Candidatus Woesearchaeota archaeon]
MALDSMDRIVLNAGLNNLLEGKHSENTISELDGILRRYANAADQSARHLKTREQDGFVAEQLSFNDLSSVGHYRGERRLTGDTKAIIFSKEGQAVEFHYKKDAQYSDREMLRDVIGPERAYSEAEQERIISGMMADVLSGKNTPSHPSEYVLGKEARTLDNYILTRVKTVVRVPLSIAGVRIPFLSTRRESVAYKIS